MLEYEVEAVVSNVEKLTGFVEEYLETKDCPMKVLMKINIAIDEVFSNICNYAYSDKKGFVNLKIDMNDNEGYFIMEFKDKGIAYNPLEKEDPDVTLAADDREIGGLGIFMVKNLMDKVEYEYKDGENCLKLTKYFTK